MSVKAPETVSALFLQGGIPDLPWNVERFPILGEGVWGKVADLQDGTVVKIAKRFSDGIGDGFPELHASLVPSYESAAGRRVDERRIWLGCAENALYGALIAESRHNQEDRDYSKRFIFQNLGKLGFSFAESADIFLAPRL